MIKARFPWWSLHHRCDRSDHMKPLFSDRSDNFFFSVIAAITAIVAIIWKLGLIYRNNYPPSLLNCYLYALQTYRTHSSKLRLLLVLLGKSSAILKLRQGAAAKGAIYYVTITMLIFSSVKMFNNIFARKLTWYFIGVYIITEFHRLEHRNLYLIVISSFPSSDIYISTTYRWICNPSVVSIPSKRHTINWKGRED